MRRVVISGVGAVSPLGNDVASLVGGTYDGRDVAGWLSALTGMSILANATDLAFEGGLVVTNEVSGSTTIFEITPRGEFVTYGEGVSLSQMRDTELARGRAPVA